MTLSVERLYIRIKLGLSRFASPEDEHIAVFPNPARDHVTLTASPAITAVVTLSTADGRQVQQKYRNGTELTLSLIGLPTGTYHTVIRTTDGTVYTEPVFHVN
jgi:hypothetical protein